MVFDESRPKFAQTKTRGMKRRPFGTLPDGRTVGLFVLENSNGCSASVTDFGATLTSLVVPDSRGRMSDVVLGFNDLECYLAGHPYLGSTIGRFGNRIANGRFSLDGRDYQLARNNGPNHLHGGVAGFGVLLWRAALETAAGEPRLGLRRVSPDGEEGYPGRVDASVTLTLTEKNELRIDYRATTDAPTIINLTNHSYFNLAGPTSDSILGHEIMINADRFTPVNADLIPTGEIRPVDGTPMDFRRMTPIGGRIDEDDDQLRLGTGYDHNWILNRSGEEPSLAALVHEPTSGRVLEVLTTEPGVQFYTGNFLDGALVGKAGRRYRRHSGFCLETQHFPDSPNQPGFPSTVLRPGETWRSTTIYRFRVEP